MDYQDFGLACDDCVCAISSGDLSSLNDCERERVERSLNELHLDFVVNDEFGFSHSHCDICNALPGNRHSVGYLSSVYLGD